MDLDHRPKTDVFEASQSDRARSLDALHDVEWAASEPGPGRPYEWRDDLLPRLDELAARLHEQFDASESEHGLLHDVAVDAPRLSNAVQELQKRQQALVQRVDDLRLELSDLSRTFDVAMLRHALAGVTAEVRELRAWETDLVYEAYTVDLGVGD